MKKMNVTVVKNTTKAVLVQDASGRQAWVQNRSFDTATNTVNADAFEKGVTYLKQRAEDDAAYRAYLAEMVDLAPFIANTTEKAVQVKADCICVHTHQAVRRSIWLPKSWLQDGKIAIKTLKQKAADVRKELPVQFQRTVEIHVCNKVFG